MYRRMLSFALLALSLALVPALPAHAQKKDGPAAKGRFEFRLVKVGKQFEAIRFDARTGESWRIDGDQFEKLPETGPVPAGDHDVTLIAVEDDWMAFRIERISGTTWMLRGRQWIRIKEPGAKKGAKERAG